MKHRNIFHVCSKYVKFAANMFYIFISESQGYMFFILKYNAVAYIGGDEMCVQKI